MPWVRLDDGFPDHPKIATLSPAAGWLHVCALCWCNRNLTDGIVPKGVEKRLTASTGVKKLTDELVTKGIWIDEGDQWRIHDYLDFQPSREQVEEERAKAAERQRKARERAAERRANGLKIVNVITPEQPPPSRRDKHVTHPSVTAASQSPRSRTRTPPPKSSSCALARVAPPSPPRRRIA